MQKFFSLSEGKPCKNAEKNPSTEVILTIYEYNSATNSYHANGRTALLKAPGVLHANVSKYIHHDNEKVMLGTDRLEELESYIPFSNDVNIESRLASLSSTVISNPPPEEDEEEYIVENIVKKNFNARLGQYEFLVKWKGYSAKHNTWELISNIPDAIIDEFERDQQTLALTHAPTRPGLRDRQTIKPKCNPNFILNK